MFIVQCLLSHMAHPQYNVCIHSTSAVAEARLQCVKWEPIAFSAELSLAGSLMESSRLHGILEAQRDLILSPV